MLKRETYDSGWDPHACELLLVFGARFCAVVCNEDDLLAFEIVNLGSSIVILEADRTFTPQQLESLEGSLE